MCYKLKKKQPIYSGKQEKKQIFLFEAQIGKYLPKHIPFTAIINKKAANIQL